MPCTNCMAEYSRLRKEVGCSKCAFGFCEKCVRNKFVIPKLSPNPVSVCDNCFQKLSNSNNSNNLSNGRNEKSRGLPTQNNSTMENWWGDDRLPPPSMRQFYKQSTIPRTNSNNSNSNGGTASKNSTTEWSDLEQRLNHLNESLKRDNINIHPLPQSSSCLTNDKLSEAQHIAQLEERLAALRGVPVEVIRKPRLMICNFDENEEEAELIGDEASRRLLNNAELSNKKNRIGNNKFVYENPALCLDDSALIEKMAMKNPGLLLNYPNLEKTSNSNIIMDNCCDGNVSNISSSNDSTIIKRVIREAKNDPSITSSSINNDDLLTPNFEECIKQTIIESKMAENEAMNFIRHNETCCEQMPSPTKTITKKNSHIKKQNSIDNKKSPLPNDETLITKIKKNGNFFSRLFK